MSVSGHNDVADAKVAVVGLGYVGLPLAIEMGAAYPTVGYDISTKRVLQLQQQVDVTGEVDSGDFCRANQLTFSHESHAIKDANTYIVTVPTPLDSSNRPDLQPLALASKLVGQVLAPGDVVIYESTVYPGATEEFCVPILAEHSGLEFNQDFFVGYSPERINPGDKAHRLPDILKVTSGSTPQVAEYVTRLYAGIVPAGTHQASSIRVAEAAKVIENTQRDINIALINELAIIFEKLDIDTGEVLAAAGTKWNFLPFRPGLVGGHCIGVDPYYLTHRAQQAGYHPEVILAGRRTNDQMGQHVADRTVRLMARNAINPVGAHVLVLGLAFKENCPDTRNSKVVDLIDALNSFNCRIDVYDPLVSKDQAREEYGLDLLTVPAAAGYDAIIAAVAHDEFKKMGADGVRQWGKTNHVLFDVKHLFPQPDVDGRL